MTTGVKKTYNLYYEHPCGDYCVRVYQKLPGGKEELVFHSDAEVTQRADGSFSHAPDGSRFLDDLLALASSKVPGPQFRHQWLDVPLEDSEIRQLMQEAVAA